MQVRCGQVSFSSVETPGSFFPQVRQSLSEHGPLGWGGVSRWCVRAEWHSSAWGGNSIIGMPWGSMRYPLEFVDHEGKGALMAP